MARFFLFLHVSGRGVSPADLFAQLRAEAQAAEAAGFTGCLVAEHHQSRDGHFPSPLTVAAFIAGCTQRLLVGTSVLLLPLYHPIHVAEDAAMVDLLSGGRLVLGCGLGYSAADFSAFGVPLGERASRTEEALQVLHQAWSGEPVHFAGKHFQLDGVQVHPQPLQRPRPPIWVGAMQAPAIRRAARLGDAWIADNFLDRASLQEGVDTYHAACAAAGRQPHLVLRRDVWVAGSQAQALEDYAPAIHSFQNFLGELKGDDRWLQRARGSSLEEIISERLIVGAPDQVAAALGRFQQVGVSDFICRFRQPQGPSHEKVMAAIRLFGEQVIPQVQG